MKNIIIGSVLVFLMFVCAGYAMYLMIEFEAIFGPILLIVLGFVLDFFARFFLAKEGIQIKGNGLTN